MNLPGRFSNSVNIAIVASLYVLISPVTGQSQSETADPDKLAADQAACQQHTIPGIIR